MTENRKYNGILKAVITVLTAGILIALGAGGIGLYIKGKAAAAAGSSEYIFSRAVAGAFLKLFLIPAVILLVLLVLAAALKIRAEETKPYLDKGTADAMKHNESISAYRGLSRRGYLIVCAAAAVLITAGIFNGGAGDLFIKAIRICAECIGLG